MKLSQNSKKPKKLRPVREPKMVELEYYKELNKLANQLKESVRSLIVPMLSEASITTDSVESILFQLEALRQRFTNIDNFANTLSSKIINKINQNSNTRFLNSVNQAIGVDLGSVIKSEGLEDIVTLQKNKNKVLIKSIPEEFFKDIEVIITNGLSSGLRHEEIARQISGIKNINSTFGKLENRVKMIARNETSSINATLNKARHESAGVELYEWQSSNDERTRPSHDAMDGKICSYKDDTIYADTIENANAGKWNKRASIGGVEKHAGMDFNCRCVAIGVIQ